MIEDYIIYGINKYYDKKKIYNPFKLYTKIEKGF